MPRVRQSFLDMRAFPTGTHRDGGFRRPAPDYYTQFLSRTGERIIQYCPDLRSYRWLMTTGRGKNHFFFRNTTIVPHTQGDRWSYTNQCTYRQHQEDNQQYLKKMII